MCVTRCYSLWNCNAIHVKWIRDWPRRYPNITSRFCQCIANATGCNFPDKACYCRAVCNLVFELMFHPKDRKVICLLQRRRSVRIWVSLMIFQACPILRFEGDCFLGGQLKNVRSSEVRSWLCIGESFKKYVVPVISISTLQLFLVHLFSIVHCFQSTKWYIRLENSY